MSLPPRPACASLSTRLRPEARTGIQPMNKLLIGIFVNEASAQAGLKALQVGAALEAASGVVFRRTRHRVDALGQEAEAKAQAMKSQLEDARGDAKARIEGRMKRVKSGFHERGAKLSQAWSLTKEALAV
jgi:predicted HNH restriction endonuclease